MNSEMCNALDSRIIFLKKGGAQWLRGRMLDSRPRSRGLEPHRRHCVVSLSKNINPGLVLVQPRKTRPFITEILLMGRKESNQANKQNIRRKQEHNSWVFSKSVIEPRHEISNNVVCTTSKASDQPAHTHSLIRAFASRLNIL